MKAIVLAMTALLWSCGSGPANPDLRVGEAVKRAPPAQLGLVEEGIRTAVFAGGCFWGVEAVFEALDGVVDVESGYAGGDAATARYELVASGTTGHAEAVQVRYDSSIISYGTLLEVFFSVAHDPTQLNYQGPDHGPQYRSAIFAADAGQEEGAKDYLATLASSGYWPRPVVTRIERLEAFYPAEDYHQDFMRLNPTHPYIVAWDQPKLEQLAATYPELLKGGARETRARWYGYEVLEVDETPTVPVVFSDAEWKRRLEPEAYRILRQAGTERSFSSALDREKRPGTFYSAATGQALFRSETKFDSGTGWPSFSRPVSPDALLLRWDLSEGMGRIEVLDSSSGSHLGHVFDDGPPPGGAFAEGTGLRFCMNGAALIFVADDEDPPPLVKDWAEAQL